MDELLTDLDGLQSTVPPFDNIPQSSDEFKRRVDAIAEQVDKLEAKVNKVEEFFSSKSKMDSVSKSIAPSEKEKDKSVKEKIAPSKKDATKREAAASKRMQELMRHMGTIIRQANIENFPLSLPNPNNPISPKITQHKWAWPFMQPVDVQGLGLDDYFEVIEKPMDFLTIKNQMEAKDGSGYKNVRDICADVRLVFKNAMKYNGVRTDVHVMAKTLLEKFEEKWLTLLPKVTEEEKRKEEEEAEAQADMHIAQEAAHAKLAKELSNQLYEIDMHLDELRDIAVQRCRKMSTDEKRKLGLALTKLSPEDLTRALEIVAQYNPGFIANAEEVDLDIDAQSESTLWMLKFFVKKAFEAQAAAGAADEEKKTLGNVTMNSSKRKREILDVFTKNKKKNTKKLL